MDSKQILDLVRIRRWNQLTDGKLDALSRFAEGGRMRQPARLRFVDDLARMEHAPRGSVVHPAATAAAANYRREGDELTPAELMWLQRLPLDPAAITHDDASRLAGIAASIDRSSSPSSHLLVWSIWQPVKDLHDRAQLEEVAALTPSAPPGVPASAAEALAEALAEEHRDWPAAAVRARADEMLTAAMEEREATHAAEVRQLADALTELDDTVADRGVLTRAVG